MTDRADDQGERPADGAAELLDERFPTVAPVNAAEFPVHSTINVFTGRAETVVMAGSIGSVHLPGTPVRPAAQLPRALRRPLFTDRVDEFTQLDQVLRSALADATAGAAPIVMITGLAGVGKTQLGVNWAHDNKKHFPDGQLFVDLRGFDPVAQPMAAMEAIRAFLLDLGVSAQGFGVEIGELARKLRSELSGRRLLVFLDNARDAAQVEPLLPASETCMVVITSRNRLSDLDDVDPQHRIELGVLAAADAMEIFRVVIGAGLVEAVTAKISSAITGVGRHTLALRLIAQRLANRPPALREAELDRVLAELGEDTGALLSERLDRVLEGSFWALREDARVLLRRLGGHVGAEFSLGAVLSLVGTDLHNPLAVLDELVAAHLVEPIDDGRYRFHDLVWAFARTLPDDDRDAALVRLSSWYAHSANAADTALRPGRIRPALLPPVDGVEPVVFVDRAAALRWCGQERANLIAVVSAGVGEHVWSIPLSMWGFLTQTRYWAEWLTAHTAAADAAVACGQFAGQAWLLNNLGTAYRELDRLAESREAFAAGLETRVRIGNRQGQSDSLKDMAMAARMAGDFDEAARLATEALDIIVTLDEPDVSGTASVLDTIGVSLVQHGQLNDAEAAYRRALTLWNELADDRGAARTTVLLADVAARRNDVDAAVADYLRALHVFERIADDWGQAQVLRDVGAILANAGRRDEAVDYWRRALDRYRVLEASQPAAELSALLDRLTGEPS